MVAADPIPAVREDAAAGTTAAIFADLRATLGVPFVNLIWRHLATMPGILEWAWALVKPLQASHELREGANALRASVVVPDCARQPSSVYDAVGVSAADRGVIAAMLRDYNAANASNLLSLLVTQSVLAGQSGQPRPVTLVSLRQQVRPALPRLLGLDELSPATLALVLELDKFGRFASTQAVASLYRHLAHWPGFLAVVHAALSESHRNGRLRAEHARMRDRARKLAVDQILPFASAPGLPEASASQAAQASLQIFTSEMIARMVVLGELMLAMLPE